MMKSMKIMGHPSIIRKIVKEDIRKVYNMTKVIGSGNYGTVRLGSLHTNQSKVFAVKSIPKQRLETEL